MGIPDRPGHRLFVGHDRSLRQHRQGDPLCGASAGNLRKYPLEERLHLEKICHDELSDLYMLCKDKRAEEQIGQCIDLHRKWLAMDDRFERPHRDTTGYMMRAYAKWYTCAT